MAQDGAGEVAIADGEERPHVEALAVLHVGAHADHDVRARVEVRERGRDVGDVHLEIEVEIPAVRSAAGLEAGAQRGPTASIERMAQHARGEIGVCGALRLDPIRRAVAAAVVHEDQL